VASVDDDALVTTFDRGNKYQAHPMYQVIASSDSKWTWSVVMEEERAMVNGLESSLDTAPEEPIVQDAAVEEVETIVPAEETTAVPVPKKKKRAIAELESSLVPTLIVPSSSGKRSAVIKENNTKQVNCCQQYGLLCIGGFICVLCCI